MLRVEADTLLVQEFQLTPEGYLLRMIADTSEVFRPAALPDFEINLHNGDEGEWVGQRAIE